MTTSEATRILEQLGIPADGLDAENLACGRITSLVMAAALRRQGVAMDHYEAMMLADALNDALYAGRVLHPAHAVATGSIAEQDARGT